MLLSLPMKQDQALPSLLLSIRQIQHQDTRKSHPCRPVQSIHHQSSSKPRRGLQHAQATTHIVMRPMDPVATLPHRNLPVPTQTASLNVQKHFPTSTAPTPPPAAVSTNHHRRFLLRPAASSLPQPRGTAAVPAPLPSATRATKPTDPST